MDSDYSFKTYSEADREHDDDKVYRRQTRKRLIIIGLSTAIFIAVAVSAVMGIVVPQNNTKSSNPTPWQPPPSASAGNFSTGRSIQEMCNNMTLYPYACTSSIASLLGSDNSSDQNLDPEQFFILSLQVSLNELANISSSVLSSKAFVNLSSTDDTVLIGAVDGCETFIKDAIGHINKSIASVQVRQGKVVLSTDKVNDIRLWLSAAITDQKTCLNGLKKVANGTALARYIGNVMRNSMEFTSNSLEIASKIITFLHNFQTRIHNRKLLRIDGGGGARKSLEEEIHTSDLTADGSGGPAGRLLK